MAVNARCLTLSVVVMPTTQGNAVRTEFVWDPTEPVATRPLVLRAKNWGLNLFYSHDGNKNVSEVFYHAPQNGIAAHYDYAPFGAVTRTNARGIVTTYTYDDWGQLLSVDYADATPDIAYTYDALGRQTSASDAAGATSFDYDAFGQLLSEQVSGLYSKTLTRHYDTFGRNVGYSVDGTRKNTLAYDPATGRLATMGDFAWEYLPGSHLKSRLTYPNGATAEWDYEPTRDLLARVTNTINGTVASQYTYTNDLLGRRTEIGKSGSMMALDETQSYGYNVRDELTSGQNQTYVYDDIGNRTTAEGKTYTANNLNQYTAIDDFTPQYDADGNQTLIKTETGIWSVTYNAENRPVCWTRGDTIVTMAFDRLGRRVDYQETQDDQVSTHFRFVYDNFLCVQRLNAANGNAVRTEFVWDPTEPIATRPLIMRAKNWGLNLFYTHDGNKNVSEVFYHALQNGIAAHYDYAPFGAVTRTSRATRVSNRDFIAENPFRFSSEYHDVSLGLVYYNYRHYNPKDGRWLGRDFVFQLNPYEYQGSPSQSDFLGLTSCCTICVYSAIKLTTNLRGPLDIGDGFSGHTWFTIEDNKNGDKSSKDGKPSKSIEFSFGPVPTGNSTKELINGVEGGDWDVGEYKDQTKYALNKRCWTADRETCCALKQEVSDFKENPEEFSAFNYCTSKAIEILRHHNIPVPDGEGEIEIPYFFNISAPNPRDLYIQLGNLPEGLPHISNNNHSTDSPSTGSKKGGSK